MTAKELQKRNAKAENLRVLQTEDGSYYVESAEGKILYNVVLSDDESGCTCGDYVKNIRQDANFRCKHILAVLNCVSNGNVESAKVLDRKKPKLDERWIIEIEGNQFVKYAGLLDLGHQKGISQIEVEPLQFPTKDNGNAAICKATVISRVGETFIDIGDANPGNCSSKVVKHLFRLASTRAIARALRSFTNIGMTCLEELSDLSDVIPKGASNENTRPYQKKTTKAGKAKNTRTQPSQKKASQAKKNVVDAEKKETVQSPVKNVSKTDAGPRMSEAQKRAIYNLSRRRGISVEDLEKMALESYGSELETLTSKDASTFIRNLQQAA
jgi:predicted nucleic acid-binding Zn finger protein